MRSPAALGGPGHLIGHYHDEAGPPEWTYTFDTGAEFVIDGGSNCVR
jgi:hypothetical protein